MSREAVERAYLTMMGVSVLPTHIRPGFDTLVDEAARRAEGEGGDAVSGARRAVAAVFGEVRDRYRATAARALVCARVPATELLLSEVSRRMIDDPDFGLESLRDAINTTADEVPPRDEAVVEAAAPPAAGEPDAPEALGEAWKRRAAAFVDRWEAVTRRQAAEAPRLGARELLLHFPRLEAAADEALLRAAAERDEAHRVASEIHAALTAAPLALDEFLELYAFEYSGEARFPETIRSRLIHGEGYSRAMRARLSELYRRGHGLAPHPEDLDHMFARVRDAVGALYGEEAVQEVARANAELNAIADAVSEQYLLALGREADEEEVRGWVARFRAEGAQAATALLADDLFEGLEFQSALRGAVQAALGPSARPRAVFDVLSRALRQHRGRMRSAFGNEGARDASIRQCAQDAGYEVV